MEVTVDVRFTYTVPEIEQIVKNMDLMTKFKGENVRLPCKLENALYK